jgi:two-component system response regulator PilR (NtrC family)
MNPQEQEEQQLKQATQVIDVFTKMIDNLRKTGSKAAEAEIRKFETQIKETISKLPPSIQAKIKIPETPSVDGEKWLSQIITQDSRMLSLKDDVRKMMRVKYPVLIRGESGTGKELIARALHGDRSTQEKGGRFVAINCAAMPPELVASELFGHKKGAFTGATEDRAGKFQAAWKGTLFLDEIGDMNLDLQSKLLRVLQENVVTPVGDNEEKKIECRVVCATHRDLEGMVERGEFRLDLFSRLNILTLRTVPLRERMGDVPLIVKSLNKDLSY